ncbi:type III-A CRISPR-associated RAMP protein Csm4 [Desulfurobacterium sp.]
MKAIRITVKPLTAFYTQLQSDTLFGEFCWHYRFLFGKENLEKLLTDYEKNPSIVFSSGFPEDYLPFPILPFDELPVEGKDVKMYRTFKKFKKQSFIKKEILKRIIESEKKLSADLLFEIFSEERKGKNNEETSLLKSGRQMHVTIDRRYGSHLEGQLFDKKYFSFSGNIEIYAKFDSQRISLEEIERVFFFMGLNGFGGEKTTGKGKFETVSIDKSDLPEAVSPDGFISLSAGMPDKNEIEDFYARFFTKFPKHGPEVCPEGINIFKNPVILTKEGSVFKYRKKKDIYGTTYRISQNENYIHCAKIFPLFVRLK